MNQLQSQKKTRTDSFDISSDHLKVLDFLIKSGKFHTFVELRRQIGIPDRRLRDTLDNHCEGYIVKQRNRYGYSHTEKILERLASAKVISLRIEADLVRLANKEKAKMRSQLPVLRRAAFEEFKQLPNINNARAMLMAYQQHPDL